MKETYEEAITKVFEDEGGYTNDPDDSGGPTNWGITIADARMYWKANATSDDVRHMPKSVAEDIYRKHYAIPLHYDDLPAGVDYAVLDYGINSGINRAARVYGQLNGPDPKETINKIYDERLSFLRELSNWGTFGRGWTRRCNEGRALALSMVDKYKTKPTSIPVVGPATAAIAGTAAVVASPSNWWPWIIAGAIVLGIITELLHLYMKRK